MRIQSERGHRVVATGVYGIVRHPMYLAAVLMFVGGPPDAILGLLFVVAFVKTPSRAVASSQSQPWHSHVLP